MKLSYPLLALTLLAASAAPTARAQTVTPNPAPIIITTAPYVISTPGFYQLGADLFYAGNGSTNDAIITIATSNVTLDFGGHFISGPSGTPSTGLYGVYSGNNGNLNIQNGTITFCYEGIKLGSNSGSNAVNINQHVNNMLVSYCYYTGIELYSSQNSDVTNCRVSFIGGTTKFAYCLGIYNFGSGTTSNCEVTSVTPTSGTTAWGIYCGGNSYAVGNRVTSCPVGFQYGKCRDNLTISCTTPFQNTTDAGNNN